MSNNSFFQVSYDTLNILYSILQRRIEYDKPYGSTPSTLPWDGGPSLVKTTLYTCRQTSHRTQLLRGMRRVFPATTLKHLHCKKTRVITSPVTSVDLIIHYEGEY